DPPADPARDRVGGTAGLHGLDRRLRHHLVRRGRGRDDAAAPDLLDAQGRGDARGQRRLDAPARADDRPDRRGPAAPAAAPGRAKGLAGRCEGLMRIARAMFVLVAAAVVAALGAAGCGGRKESPAASGEAAKEKKLNLYIWSAYMPQEVLDDFTKQTGIAVHFDLYDSNESGLEKPQAGVADYDLVVPWDYMVRILIPLTLTQPLQRERLHGWENLDPRFVNKGFDPGNRYSFPYVWGTTGYGYSKERVRGTPDSWA